MVLSCGLASAPLDSCVPSSPSALILEEDWAGKAWILVWQEDKPLRTCRLGETNFGHSEPPRSKVDETEELWPKMGIAGMPPDPEDKARGWDCLSPRRQRA